MTRIPYHDRNYVSLPNYAVAQRRRNTDFPGGEDCDDAIDAPELKSQLGDKQAKVRATRVAKTIKRNNERIANKIVKKTTKIKTVRNLKSKSRVEKEPKLNIKNIVPEQQAEFPHWVAAITDEPYSASRDYTPYYSVSSVLVKTGSKFSLPILITRNLGNYSRVNAKCRVIFIKDLTNLPAWLQRNADPDDLSIPEEIASINKILIRGALIEGIDFNQSPDIIKQFDPIQDESHAIIINKFYLTNHHGADLNHFADIPISQQKFFDNWTKELQIDNIEHMRNIRKDIKNLQSNLLVKQMVLGRLNFIHTSLTTSGSKHIADEIARIEQIAGVTKLQYRNGGICFTTEEIWHPDKTETMRYLGQFEVIISLKSSIKFRNLRAATNIVHPHEISNNEVCQGSYFTVLTNAYTQMSYYLVALATLEYIRTVNLEDSAGYHSLIDNFITIRVPDAQAKITKWLSLFNADNDDD